MSKINYLSLNLTIITLYFGLSNQQFDLNLSQPEEKPPSNWQVQVNPTPVQPEQPLTPEETQELDQERELREEEVEGEVNGGDENLHRPEMEEAPDLESEDGLDENVPESPEQEIDIK